MRTAVAFHIDQGEWPANWMSSQCSQVMITLYNRVRFLKNKQTKKKPKNLDSAQNADYFLLGREIKVICGAVGIEPEQVRGGDN